MGLDMYLYRKFSIHKPYSEENQEPYNKLIKDIQKVIPSLSEVNEVSELSIYWRKANHIHAWFDDKIGDGEGSNSTYYVDIEDLKKLKEDALEVKESLDKSKKEIKSVQVGTSYSNGESTPIIEEVELFTDTKIAEEVMPTRSGFFFGGTLYDSWYYNSLVELIENLDRLIKEDEKIHEANKLTPLKVWVSYEYSASW